MRYKCTVAYLGANYEGWQTQKRNTSIQEIIEAVLYKITNQEIIIVGSGRTDAKVNAKGQVFHFDTDLVMDEYKWKGALNAYLPDDIYINNVEEVEDTFHARYAVKKKEYIYHIMQEYDVFKKDIALYIPYQLDIEAMQEASKEFIGEHDFTSFNASSLEEYPNQTRIIDDIKFEIDNKDILISFIGKGFLRYMVRMMIAALIEVGRGAMNKEDIIELLNKPSKKGFAKNAEAHGLCLNRVEYFDILALNELGMIREVLDQDKISDKEYVFTTRNTQEVLGYFDNIKNIIYIYQKDNIDLAKTLINDLEKRLNKNIDIELIA